MPTIYDSISGDVVSVTIASGATASEAVDADGYAAFGVALPAAFTGTSLAVEVSTDGAAFQALSDDTGTVVSLTVAQGNSYALPVGALAPWPWFRLVSGSAEAAERILNVARKG